MASAGIEFLYGILAVVFICLVVALLMCWLQWRKRHTKETQEVRVIFPDGTVRRTIVTRTDVWPHLGKLGEAPRTDEYDDKAELTENDHIEIIFGEAQVIEETGRSVRRPPVFPIPGVTVTSDDL